MGGMALPFTDGAVVKSSSSLPLSLSLYFLVVEGNVSFQVGLFDLALTTPYVIFLRSQPGTMAQAFGGVVLFEELPTMITNPSLIFAAADTNNTDFGAVPYPFKGREGVS